MMMRRPVVHIATVATVCILVSGFALAQREWRRFPNIQVDRNGVPTWEVDQRFQGDLFTFARVRYESYGRGGGWAVDYPDSDLNFSLRLQQLTTLNVNPNPVIIDLTDDKVFDYPFLYIIEPGGLYFSEPEIEALRRYCFNGGFVMVDDFWGDSEYENMRQQLSRVFPDRAPIDVPLSHEIFHNVYDLKERPQVPSIGWASRGREEQVQTWEPARDGTDTSQVNYRAILDDDDRIMVLMCHNTDLGDGWEQEGVDPLYFSEFSVKRAYPMGINIITYAMTH
jgi:hypothetical protein